MDVAVLGIDLGKNLFAKLKHLMRKAEERTHPAAWRRVGALLDLVSSTECANYLAIQATLPPKHSML